MIYPCQHMTMIALGSSFVCFRIQLFNHLISIVPCLSKKQKLRQPPEFLFPPHISSSSCACPNPLYLMCIMCVDELSQRGYAPSTVQYVDAAAVHYGRWYQLLLLYCFTAPVAHAARMLVQVDRHSGIVPYYSTASKFGILTDEKYSNKHTHQYLVHIV